MAKVIYFGKKDNPAVYQDMRWILAAVSKEDTRFNLARLCAKPDRLEACDGHRLHIIDRPPQFYGLEPGFYEVKRNTKTQGIVLEVAPDDSFWPDTDVVIPNKSEFIWFYSDRSGGAVGYETERESFMVERSSKYYGYVTAAAFTLARAMDSNGLNLNYLREALDIEERFDAYVTDGTHPVLLANHNYRAVIMPMRL